jgi:hypothetical protein
MLLPPDGFTLDETNQVCEKKYHEFTACKLIFEEDAKNNTLCLQGERRQKRFKLMMLSAFYSIFHYAAHVKQRIIQNPFVWFDTPSLCSGTHHARGGLVRLP